MSLLVEIFRLLAQIYLIIIIIYNIARAIKFIPKDTVIPVATFEAVKFIFCRVFSSTESYLFNDKIAYCPLASKLE